MHSKVLILKVFLKEAFPFSKGSSQPMDQTQVSWIAGGFFTNSAIREALLKQSVIQTYSEI